MDESNKRFLLKINNDLVEVDKNIYNTYYKMYEREKYLEKRDLHNGLIHYDSWNTDSFIGREFISDIDFDTENKAFETILSATLWRCVEEANDDKNICYLIAVGYTEREIAQISGVSLSAINKQKKKLFEKIKKLINFKINFK